MYLNLSNTANYNIFQKENRDKKKECTFEKK